MSDDKQTADEAADRLAELVLSDGNSTNEARHIAREWQAKRKPLEPGVYRCWRDGNDSVLVVADDGNAVCVDTVDGHSVSMLSHEVTDIRPLQEPPAPRELMQRVEKYIQTDLNYWNAKRPGQNYGTEELLAAVRRHTDPELPAKLRKWAAQMKKWYPTTAEEMRQLADELEP